MKKLSAQLLVLVTCVASIKALCQSDVSLQKIKNPVYPSPTAASLGKYSDIPVSYHTGVPSISIPIYTVTEGSLQLPISLSYHAGGIRVDETASSIGLGWSLNAGGMISRTVNGGPDEGFKHFYGATPQNGWGFYKDGGVPDQIKRCQDIPADNSMGLVDGNSGFCCQLKDDKRCDNIVTSMCIPCGYYYQDAAIGAIDLEPDLYNFNVNGYAGKFFFDANRNAHFLQETGVFVKPLSADFSKWMLITPDGTKYFFGNYNGVDGTEKSYADPDGLFTNFWDLVANTTWYLTRVESMNGERWIQLEYDIEYYCFANRRGQTYALANASSGANPDPSRADPTPAISFVNGRRLRKITTSSGNTTIDFNPSQTGREDLNHATSDRFTDLRKDSDAKTIASIEITSPGLYKKFSLSQSYFVSNPCVSLLQSDYNSAPQHRKRLRLDELVESDKDNNRLPPYHFGYSYFPPPDRYSLARDEQGFYNGRDTNDGWFQDGKLVKTNGYTYTLHTGDDHQPDESSMKAGTLTVIRYPLGRVTYFDYEAHRTPLKMIGGLRIKRITEKDEDGVQITREFKYEQPKLYFDDSNTALVVDENNVDHITNEGIRGGFAVYYALAPVVPFYSAQGYNIAYDKVTETSIGSGTSGNGSKVYTYYSFAPSFPAYPKYPITPVITLPGSGEEKSETFLDNNSLAVSTKTYDKIPSGSSSVLTARKVGISTSSNGTPPSSGVYPTVPLFGQAYYQDYDLPAYTFNTQTDEMIEQGVSTSHQYTYTNGKIKPSVVETTNSRGDTERIDITYPDDAGSGAPSLMFNPSDANYKNLIYEPLRITTSVAGNVISKDENIFETSTNGTKINLTKSIHYPSGTSASRESTYRYDDKSNLISIKSSDGLTTSFKWGYNNSYVVARVVGSEPEMMYYEGFEGFNDNNVSTDAKTGLKSYGAALNVTLPQPGTYVLSYWQKDGSGKWTYIISDNVTTDQTIGGSGILIDEVRMIPRGARMTTKQFNPGQGLITDTDINGNSVYYEYDGFGRLKVQRDTDKNITKAYEYQIQQK
ncbi:MAG TPA: RHS repeat domain-containing protein [Cyclobacteriaceae bacterium]|jgi:YD repeat-containing protein|nr:RHS repeat domain-containing protein [Cyclobacteriaceae bacterium]